MKQFEFVLKVVAVKDLETKQGHEDDYDIVITAWDLNSRYMIDQHITSFYPQLMDEVGIEELCEGKMYYSGGLDTDTIKETLNRMGFIIDGSSNHKKVLNGEKVDMVLTPRDEEDYDGGEYHEEEGVMDIADFQNLMEDRFGSNNVEEEEVEEVNVFDLQRQLNRAVRQERYEDAAILIDEIIRVSGS